MLILRVQKKKKKDPNIYRLTKTQTKQKQEKLKENNPGKMEMA
jgi:hypothetical protein